MMNSKVIFVLLVAWVLVLCPFDVFAQAQPKPENVGRAVSGVLQDGFRARGFAANDPRILTTLTRVGGGFAGAAAGAGAVVVGGVTAPAWVTVAIAAGISAVVGYAVTLGLDSLVNWLFRSDGKIDESGNPVQVPIGNGMVVGGAYWKVQFISAGVDIQISGGDGESIARQGYADYLSQTRQDASRGSSVSCSVAADRVTCGVIAATRFSSGAPASCPAGSVYRSGACSAYSFLSPVPVASKTAQTPQQAISDIPAGDLQKKLNPVLVAALANVAWQNAASQTNSDALAYPQGNPITAAEAARWLEANPGYAPTIGDFVAPNPVSSGSPSPWSLPSNPTSATTVPASNTGTTTNPAASQPLQNLGGDPGIGAPTLEQIPTAQMILSPILGLLPDFKNYSPSLASGVCPRPTLSLFGGSQTFEAHCTILENNGAVIHTSMVLAWSLLALFILLSA